MTRPRQVLPNQFYLITRSCTQQQFLLRPDDETTNAFAYCLAIAAERYKIEVLMATVESNHHHTVIFDRHGTMPKFIEHLHKLTARCINTLRGRWENLWVAEEACVTVLLDIRTLIAKLIYVAGNPVKDYLVERAVQWPGLNGYRHLLSNKPIVATRPRFFFRKDGSMPATATLTFSIPAELPERDEILAELKSGVEDLERTILRERAKSGRKIVGRREILKRSWRDSPNSERPHRTLRPRFAGTPQVRGPAIAAFKDFLTAYRKARKRWQEGLPCRFPPGTYWLSRFTPIPVQT